MKKTLIALATLASFGSAFAQTSVTMYGVLDIGLSNTNTTTGAGSNSTTAVTDGGYVSPSHLGIKVQSDLGGGLTAYGQLEEGFSSQNPANGFTAAGATNRGANIGIGGSFGRVDFGTMWGPYDNVANDVLNYNHFSPYSSMLNAGAAFGDNGSGTISKTAVNGNAAGTTTGSIQYTTPTVGGFNAAFNYAPQKDGFGNDASTTQADVTYAAGPLAINAAYEHVPTVFTNDGTAATVYVLAGNASPYSNGWHIDGVYDLTVAKLGLSIMGSSVNGVLANGAGTDTDAGWTLGASFPMGQWTPGISIASVKVSGDNLNQTTTAYGAQALYSMSKMATYYIGYRNAKTTYVSGASDTTVGYFATGLTFAF